jgi:N-acetylglucosaminyl-diphospho-decaprenol L-rhamnosyltransferase
MRLELGLDRRMIGDRPATGIIDVVIVNWNSGSDLARCLESLTDEGSAALVARIIIVDNGSHDGSAALAPDAGAPPLIIDHANRNLGFAVAANRGAAKGNAPFILFLNPDTRLHAGALAAALGGFGPEIGLVGLRQCDESGQIRPSCSRFPTPLAFWMRAFGLDRLSQFARYAPFLEDPPHEASRLVDQVMGACLLIPRDLFAALSGFDERFFLYYEDVDLALRAHRLGRRSWYETGGTVTHTGGGSSRQVPAHRLCLSLASRLAYARKHFTRAGFLSVAVCTLLAEPWTRLTFAALHRGTSSMRAVAAGYALLLRVGSARP